MYCIHYIERDGAAQGRFVFFVQENKLAQQRENHPEKTRKKALTRGKNRGNIAKLSARRLGTTEYQRMRERESLKKLEKSS